MRRMWGIIGCLLITVSPLWAGSVLLNWENPTLNDDGTPLTDLSHINVFYGTSTGSYTHQVNAGLATSASIGGLTDAQRWFFAVSAVDTTGNPSLYSNEVSAILPPPLDDTTPPTVSLTFPTNGSTVQHKSRVTIAADASDNVGVARVTFYVNGSLQCTSGSTPYTCAWHVPAPRNRHYRLQANAYDTAGNVNVSTIIEVISQ